MKKLFNIFIFLTSLIFLSTNVFALTQSLGGRNTDGSHHWEIQDDGDIVPGSATAPDIGESGYEVTAGYFDAIVLGGVSKSSWGSVSSPWEDNGTTTVLTSSPTKFILTHSTGDIKTTRMTTDDIYGTTNAQNIDLSTNNAFKLIDNSDTLTITATGNDFSVDSSDGGVIFALTDATDGTVDLQTNNDTDDYIQVSTTTNQPLINFVGCNGKITAASGTIDFDDENLTTTGTASLGATTVTSVIIGDDTLDVVVDDELRFYSNDSDSTIEAYGYEAKDGILLLTADESDDNGDEWEIESDATSNDLLFNNDTSGSLATIFTIADSGIVTTTNDVVAVNDSATTNAVQDILKLTSSSTGTAAAGLGTGIVLHVEDAGGIEEQGSIDCALTTNTDAAEDADIIFSQNTAGAIAETLRLVAASSATTTDYLKYTANTTETNAVTDVFVLTQVTGTAANGNGIGISFQPEDAGGAEEQASIDIALTDATDSGEDADIIFSQNVAGTITERVRFDADDANILLSGSTPNIVIGDAGEEDTDITFDGNAQDFYIGLDDSADDLLIGLGASVGTTPAISIDENQDVAFAQNVLIKELNFAADGEASDTYVITLAPAPAAYVTGQMIIFTANTANTGACTVNVNGLGAKSLKSLHDQDPADNYIESGSVVMAVYDGTNFQILQPDANP